MKLRFGPFKRYLKRRNNIHSGFLYTLNLKIPGIKYEPKRTIRVYLPSDFDENKTYPVLYMVDGQNIVDSYTSAYGEWNIDDHIEGRIENNLSSFIVVGIDCPKGVNNRTLEYTCFKLPYKKKIEESRLSRDPYGKELAKFIVSKLKPLIDKTFPTKKEKDFTGIGGSSMGGLFSFDVINLYPDIFGYSLSFSPAFMLYDNDVISKQIREEIKNNINKYKIYFYSGGSGFDAMFYKETRNAYNILKEMGFDKEHLRIKLDKEYDHNEEAWSDHFYAAIKFWLD